MKKYKLKKDLPRAKTGSEVVLFPVKDNFEISRINLFQENWNNSRLGFIRNEDIDEWLEEIPQKPKSVFDLKFGDRYFTKDSYWATIERNWQNNYTENQLQKEGKIFLTKEECDKDYEKELAIQRIKKYCWENNLNTEYRLGRTEIIGTRYWTIITNSVGNHFIENPIWYFSEYEAKNILEKFEDDLKIIFNV